MPNYNASKYLPEALESVISQSYENWELLIVDDCSTDDSVSIINDYQKKDSRIKLFVNQSNKGAAFSRNYALIHATGKWIAFLDSDDIWFKNKLSSQIKFMKNNKYHFSYTKYRQVDEHSIDLGKTISGPKKVSKRKMFHFNYLGCLTVMYDKDYIGLIQVDDRLKSKNDYAMWLKASQKSSCYLFDETLAFYRVRKKSISHGSFKKSIRNQFRLYKIGMNMSFLRSSWHLLINMLYGSLKKVCYVRRKRL